MKEPLINIAIPGVPRKALTYKWPDNLGELPRQGQRCLVPVGRRRLIGYYLSPAEQYKGPGLKAVIDTIEKEALFNREIFNFLSWMADYYLANIGDVLSISLPPELRKIRKPSYLTGREYEQGLAEGKIPEPVAKIIARMGAINGRRASTLERKYPGLLEEMQTQGILKAIFVVGKESDAIHTASGKSNIFDYILARPEVGRHTPNKEQAEAITAILADLGRFTPYLLHGITGSGKTLVYCHIAAEIIRQNKTVLVLVPEIALAGTLLAYFKSFFPEHIALLHSALKPGDRLRVWQNIRDGQYKIVIGARSAIFAPLDNLGLIIVDEEHDESYKQDDPAPRFQGRDSAVMRAKLAGIPIILGSASPSVESFYNALSGRYQLLRLTRRPETIERPIVRLVDLKEEFPSDENIFFTKTLVSHVRSALHKKEQVILYLNRRGFSPRIKCTDCGHTPLCPHCQLHLTYHRAGNKLMCHFCGYINSSYNACASCGGGHFLYIGTGTQKIEENIGGLFPEAQMIRLDSDSAAERDRAHIILSDFAAGKYNLLLGTQMVTKGIDFPRVSLVGVLMADIGMDMPDFRASEKLFAKLIQVAGRSGRGMKPGEVIIQTFNPEIDLIDDAARQDYDTFYTREIKSRKELDYPPFAHIVNFRFSAKKEESLQKAALTFRKRLSAGVEKTGVKGEILGPAPSPLYRLRGLYRRHLFVKTGQISKFVKFLSAWEQAEQNFGLPSSIKLIVDIDPYDMM
jgi:primosomal protein N' (replication factor Y) (superfamily II helicase)